jgi:hypothetical protein
LAIPFFDRLFLEQSRRQRLSLQTLSLSIDTIALEQRLLVLEAEVATLKQRAKVNPTMDNWLDRFQTMRVLRRCWSLDELSVTWIVRLIKIAYEIKCERF